MKKTFAVFLFLCFLSGSGAFAHVVSFNPLYALFGFNMVNYELPLNDSIGLEFSGTSRNISLLDWNYNSFTLGLLPKFYFNSTCPSGAWWGPIVMFTNSTGIYKPTNDYAAAYNMGAGLATGYKWVFGKDAKEGFILELGVGYVAMGIPDIEVNGETLKNEGTLSGVVIKSDIGWAF